MGDILDGIRDHGDKNKNNLIKGSDTQSISIGDVLYDGRRYVDSEARHPNLLINKVPVSSVPPFPPYK